MRRPSCSRRGSISPGLIRQKSDCRWVPRHRLWRRDRDAGTSVDSVDGAVEATTGRSSAASIDPPFTEPSGRGSSNRTTRLLRMNGACEVRCPQLRSALDPGRRDGNVEPGPRRGGRHSPGSFSLGGIRPSSAGRSESSDVYDVSRGSSMWRLRSSNSRPLYSCIGQPHHESMPEGCVLE